MQQLLPAWSRLAVELQEVTSMCCTAKPDKSEKRWSSTEMWRESGRDDG